MPKNNTIDKAKGLIAKFGIEEFQQVYYAHSNKEVFDKFSITETVLNKILDIYNIPKKTSEQIEAIKKHTTQSRYGSPTFRNTSKSKQTKLEKYGDSNFNNPEKAQQTMQQKYGVKHALQSDTIKQKQRQTNFNRHGSEIFHNQEKIKETNLRKYGVENVFQREDIKKLSDIAKAQAAGSLESYYAQNCIKIQQTKLAKYGDSRYNNKEKAQQTCIDKYGTKSYLQTEEFKVKSKQTMLDRYGVSNPSQIPHIASKKSKRYVAEEGITMDSSWEVQIYEYFKRIGKSVERNIPIEYTYNDKKHITMIDFKVDNYLMECKGSHLLQGCFDYADNIVPISVKLDVYRTNHVIVVTDKGDIFGKPNSKDSNGLRYQQKCPNPLIGVDIALFNNPDFPYAKDRPKCFYKVKVDGKPCALDAWQDEALRWEMIKNRIEYSGGFIDAKQILNAMNITRTCKQPSWFSKAFAKKIISKYATTDIIVDPFAGWGARYDASMELDKTYIGSDYNEELVEWHHSLHRDISYKDANEFFYDGVCSVFICPPYSDPKTGRCFEDYNFENFDTSAKAMSQCDWLKLCMKNIPNAAEYIMVCKVVDEGFEQYIIEDKENHSHFGLNKEHVIIIPQEEKKKALCL